MAQFDVGHFSGPEVRREVTVNAINTDDKISPTSQLFSYFSDWRWLKIAFAWLLRLKAILLEKRCLRKQAEAVTADNLKLTKPASSIGATMQIAKITSWNHTQTVDELLGAEVAIVRYSQQVRFREEIAALTFNKATVSRQSSRLDPVLNDGLLRVGGRLSKAAMPEDIKHPLILSKDQHISPLILKHVHKNLGQSGRSHTLSAVGHPVGAIMEA